MAHRCRRAILIVGLVTMVTAAWASACSRPRATAGFWFDRDAFDLSSEAIAKLGGPLTAPDIVTIDRVARAEIGQAFAGMNFTLTTKHDAFWRVAVLATVRGKSPIPSAGQSLALGPLGGDGSVGFGILALNAIRYAPADAPRRDVVEAIGRGVGRAAVHEFAHQIAGTPDNDDENSFECGRSDRASQYYGALHWTTALPALRQKLSQQSQ
jgi:hypothetical protein